MKVCKICSSDLGDSHPTYYGYLCKSCYNDARASYYNNHKEEINARRRKQRDENDRAYDRERYANNSAPKRMRASQYRKDHPDKNAAYTRKHAIQAGGNLTHKELESIRYAANYQCMLCGSHENLSVDHIVPVSKGGKGSIDNLQILCRSCNSKKHVSFDDYRDAAFFLRLNEGLKGDNHGTKNQKRFDNL